MGLMAYFQQEIPVFQHRISTLLCQRETQSRHSHETWRDMETRDRAKTRHTSVETEPIKDRDMENHVSRQYRDKTSISRHHHCIIDHLTSNKLRLPNPYQSACEHYFTETALLYKRRIAKSIDLCLLGLSVVFDTIDHNILIISLSSWFGLHGSVFNWLKSYLSFRFSVLNVTIISPLCYNTSWRRWWCRLGLCSALVSINEVILRRARLVLGWVTVCGRVNHLGL